MTAEIAIEQTYLLRPMNAPDLSEISVQASSVEDVRQFALEHCDKTRCWYISLNGRGCGPAFQSKRYRCTGDFGEIRSHTFEHHRPLASWFDTKEQARAHYAENLPEANAKLDAIEASLKEHRERFGYEMGYVYEGDEHGIVDDYMFISVKLNGYTYARRIEM